MSAVIKKSTQNMAEAVLKPTEDVSLAGRARQFQDVMAATQVTDRAGTRVDLEASLARSVDLLKDLRTKGGRLYIVGNGGSAGVASHAVTDFLNVVKLKAFTLHDPSLLSCMSNDYGYDVAFARILATVASPGDVLIAIS